MTAIDAGSTVRLETATADAPKRRGLLFWVIRTCPPRSWAPRR